MIMPKVAEFLKCWVSRKITIKLMEVVILLTKLKTHPPSFLFSYSNIILTILIKTIILINLES